jgi:hypothetical protein
VTEVLPNSQIFVDKIGPGDIIQGKLGDCYYLAGLAALTERPNRILNLFVTTEVNEYRYFALQLLYRGKWVIIHMD